MSEIMGRPRSEIDWEQFDKLIWIPVLSNDQLADVIGVSKSTLERRVKERYQATIDAIRLQKQGPMRHKLFSAMWKSAMSGNVTSQIWLSKNIFGWSDKLVHAQGEASNEKLVINFGGRVDPSHSGKVDSREPVSEGDQESCESS